MNTKTIGIVVGVIALMGGGLFLLQTGADSTNRSSSESGLQVVTSFYPLQFALERIVGEAGTVTNIGAGRDPHDFEPSTRDMVALTQADVVVLQGADFEPWGDDVMVSLAAENVPVIVATVNLELHEGGHKHDDHDDHDEHADDHDDNHDNEHEKAHEDEPGHDDEHGHDEESNDDNHADEEEHDHDHGAYDPHTWLDPVLFSETVAYLAAELAVLDPTNAALFQANAEELRAELAVLDETYAERLSNCSLNEVITSHDAFGYLGDRYNFAVHSIAGISTQDMPSVATLAELRTEAAEGIGAILLEENSVTAYGETLARETGLKTLGINPIAYVIPVGEDYLTLMQSNLNTFAVALACDV